MTATATKTAAATKEAEAAAERIRELNEQVLDFGKKTGFQFLEAFETNMKTFADYQDKVADAAQVEWVATAARAQANFTREITRVYSTTTRDLLK
jgi:hypothetical protein